MTRAPGRRALARTCMHTCAELWLPGLRPGRLGCQTVVPTQAKRLDVSSWLALWRALAWL